MMQEELVNVKNVLEAVKLVNHHAKNQKWICKWLDVCECPDEAYRQYKKKQGYGSSLFDLDRSALVHYGIRLNAVANEGRCSLDDMPIVGIDNWEEAGYFVEESSSDFVYPNCNWRELRERILKDKDYIYALKRKCLVYFLENSKKENVNARVLTRELGEENYKKIGIEIVSDGRTYKFHLISDFYFEMHPELPIKTDDQKEKFKIYNLYKQEVVNAINIVEEFLQSRDIQLPERVKG